MKTKCSLFAATLIALSFLTEGSLFAQYAITTLAATSQTGPRFDGIGVAVDRVGNVYATGANPQVAVLRINGAGIATVVGGYGSNPFPGCGYPATGIGMTDLSGVSADSSGNLYVFEGGGNGPLLRVSSGIAYCLLGGAYFFGNGIAADNAGDVYFSASVPNAPGYAIYEATASGGRITVAGNGNVGCSGGLIGNPYGLALDSGGNLYVADASCNVIWKVSQPGATPVAVAGNGIAGYSGDGGPATSASLDQPRGVAVDPYGNVFIADSANNVIRKVTGNVITTIAGDGLTGLSGDGGLALSASLDHPIGIAVGPGGVIYVGDQTENTNPNTRIRQLTPPGSQIISPAPGSVLPTNVWFRWTSTAGATYQLDVSDKIGAIGQGDIFTGQTGATSLEVSNLPCDGRTIYVQLATQINGTWQQVGPYTYTACTMVTLTSTPPSLPQQGGTVTLSAIVENFSPSVETVQLKVTESLYPRLPICYFNFLTGSYTCTYPSPTVISTMPLTLVPGVPQTLKFSLAIGGLPAGYQYGRTFVFAATVTSSTGAVLGSATVKVTQY